MPLHKSIDLVLTKTSTKHAIFIEDLLCKATRIQKND